MKRFHEQLKNKANHVRLTRAEKHDLRERIVSYMEYHPLPQGMRTSLAPTPSFAGTVVHRISVFAHDFYAGRATGALAVIVLMLVPFVAERAVPGDVLYPVKVRFNEEVRSTLARSAYEQVVWETERLERRLAEARVLASEGKLTPEFEAQVAEAVKAHSSAAQESIASIRVSDSDEAAFAEIAFSSALAVQSEMLEGRSATIASAVDAAQETARESQQVNKPSYEKLLARIEQESTNAYELFNTVSEAASATEQQDVEDRLEDVRHTVTSAQTLKETDGEEAVAMLTTALADTRKVISFMTDIDVRSTISIDDLIPHEMTEEERRALIADRLTHVAETEVTITAQLDTVDMNTRNAMEARLLEMRTGAETASTSLAAGDIAAADAASETAHTIAEELQAVLDQYEAAEEEVLPIVDPATTTATDTDAQPNEMPVQ